ncbi:MAG: hypothetical protein ACFFDH_26120, partial [Promethearchaeota archaeon]
PVKTIPDFDYFFTIDIDDQNSSDVGFHSCNKCEKLLNKNNRTLDKYSDEYCKECVEKYLGYCEICNEYVPYEEIVDEDFGDKTICNECYEIYELEFKTPRKEEEEPNGLIHPSKLPKFLNLLNNEKYQEAVDFVNSFYSYEFLIHNEQSHYILDFTRVFAIRPGIKPWKSFFDKNKNIELTPFSKADFINKADLKDEDDITYGERKYSRHSLSLIFSFVEDPTIWLPSERAPLVIQNDKISVYLVPKF